MKKIIVISMMLCLLSTPVIADEYCESIGRLAAAIMESRQAGVSADKSVEASRGNPISLEMIIEAHETPRFHSYRYERASVEDFKNRWYLKCIKARMNQGE